ncbi:DUF2500 domain-containing protein [Paenibacillus gansuensis]|uniref:DUF2500 domain-containing protein n=1 Tax=Paenibacillus gansuensis TaxID=306542 RepID=A0ABW5PCD6_9BACL
MFEQPGVSGGFFHGAPPVFLTFFLLIFCSIAGLIAYKIFGGVRQWSANNASPILNIEAKIISKRYEVWGGSGDSSASTSYFVTFEQTDGTRTEFAVANTEYGLLAEGDIGTLSYQGTRYHHFVRNREYVKM